MESDPKCRKSESQDDTPEEVRTISLDSPSSSQSADPESSAARPAANPDSPVPFIFGQHIARGGMGAILEADDCKFGRKIAVKVMLSEADSDDEQRSRFVQEAAVLGRLEHPNIVPVHDLGRDSNGDLYYTMKLVKGQTLQAILDSLRLRDAEAIIHYPLDQLLDIFRKVCDAIAFAHSEKIIHRDLKPENIMVGEFGEVLVMDWGLSKILGADRDATKDNTDHSVPDVSDDESSSEEELLATLEGSILGTPRYMSPEQATGDVAAMDTYSDIYALGGILYAVLTLNPPVNGDSLYEVLSKVEQGTIPPPIIYETDRDNRMKETSTNRGLKALPHLPNGRIPASLSAVALKALSLKKTERYENVIALGTEIESWQRGFATLAERASLAKQVGLLVKRNKGVAITGCAAWILLLALGAWFIFNLKAKEQEALAESERASKAEDVAIANQEVAREKEQEARDSAVRANLALAEASLREGNGLALLTALEDIPKEQRDSTWQYFQRRADTSIFTIPTRTRIQSAVAHPILPSV
ncbi:MAG: serine/threonine-protein kinase, partial [Verrucomicrobiota bacterium]